jgi:hypothetical protein
MSYTYDNAGNVTTISDALAGPQAQEFSYNDADMVIQANAAGGTDGLYSENYSYSSGNLYNKGGVTNTYGDPAHPHAVTERSNGNTYVYDDNGNQTCRCYPGLSIQDRLPPTLRSAPFGDPQGTLCELATRGTHPSRALRGRVRPAG